MNPKLLIHDELEFEGTPEECEAAVRKLAAECETVRPPTYPELEREAYLALEPATERETMPAPECAHLFGQCELCWDGLE